MPADTVTRTADVPAVRARTRRVLAADALGLLDAADGDVRFYWAENGEHTVGIGEAVRIAADGPDRFVVVRDRARRVFGRLDDSRGDDVPSRIRPRFCGGFSFDDNPGHEGRWQAFPAACFILPRRQITATPEGTFETLADVGENADHPDPVAANQGRPTRAEDPAGARDAWKAAVAAFVDEISNGDLTKAVLARAERRPVRHHLTEVLEHLASRPDPTTRFLFEPMPGHAFYGASPELLVRLDGRRLRTTALAGSIGRGASSGEDATLARILMSSPKDSLEHEVVVSYMLEQLANAHVEEIRHHRRRVLRLAHVQHLETPIEAIAPEGTHVLDLAARFHPTPAVGGIPREQAIRLIHEHETFSRGWYAGGIGWFDASGDGVISTTIRSALTTPEATWLFAGAGIVAGSEPEAEWSETEMKLRQMDEALSHGVPR